MDNLIKRNNLAADRYRELSGDKDFDVLSYKDVSLKEYLALLEGRDEKCLEKGNSSVTMSIMEFTADDINEKTLGEKDRYELLSTSTIMKAAVKVRKLPHNMVMLELTFNSDKEPELILLKNRVDKFFNDYSNFITDDKASVLPIIYFDVMGKRFLGDSYLSFANPLFSSLEPEVTGSSNINVYKLLFDGNDMSLEVIDEDELVDLDEDIAYTLRNDKM